MVKRTVLLTILLTSLFLSIISANLASAQDLDPSSNANVGVNVEKAVAINLSPSSYTITVNPSAIPPGGSKEFFSSPGKLFVMCNYKAHIVITSRANVPRQLEGRLVMYVNGKPYDPNKWQGGVDGPGIFQFGLQFSIKADWKLEAGRYSAVVTFTVTAG